MFPSIRYVSGSGEEIPLSSDGAMCSVTDLMEWAYDVDDSNGRIRGFTRDVETVKIPVATYSEGVAAEIYRVTSRDRRNVSPGRLYVGEWYIECFVTGSSFERWWDERGLMKVQLSVTVEEHVWHRETTKVITSRGDASGLDFAYDFQYDFGFTSTSVTVSNDGYDDADLLIRVYGPCSSPVVTVGGNEYGASVDLASGEYLEISTADKTLVVTKYDGNKENAFPKILGEYMEGSGSYVFQRLAPGTAEVTWGGAYDLDVVVVQNADQPGVI